MPRSGNKRKLTAYGSVLGLMALMSGLVGCEQQTQPTPAQMAPAGPRPVTVQTLNTEPVVLKTDLPGRTAAYLVAEVRPQVTGIIQKRLFEEGDDVHEGELLYKIDAARYEAVLAQTKASLAMVQAELPALQSRVARYSGAVSERAISQQALDEANSALNHALATIALREAEIETAQINLDYTDIKAPISGRIGKSNITVGALATANQMEALSTIRQFDPIYVDVMQSSAELLRLRRELETGELQTDGAQKTVRLRLEDGTLYAHEGTLQFRDIAVDHTTGAFTLRIVFPNPDGLLLPGMFVRAVVQEGVRDDAILIPQQTVSRTPKGEAVALVVGADDVVQQRKLTLVRAIENRWLVGDGLAAGDQLIVQGAMGLRPGDKVQPSLAETNTETDSSKQLANGADSNAKED